MMNDVEREEEKRRAHLVYYIYIIDDTNTLSWFALNYKGSAILRHNTHKGPPIRSAAIQTLPLWSSGEKYYIASNFKHRPLSC